MTAYLGPIQTPLYNPQLGATSAPTELGIGAVTLSGMMEWAPAHQLREVTENPARKITVGRQAGVLEPVWFDDDLLRSLNGWALLQSCQIQASQEHSLNGVTGLVPYTLTFARLPVGTSIVVTRSAATRLNDYGVVAMPLVANPVHDAEIDGSPFLLNPGGTRFTRLYDAHHPHDTANLTPAAENVRAMTIYTAAMAIDDPLEPVVLPPLSDAPGVPGWVTKRGGDCRFFDRTDGWEVYGPHPFATTTDCQITNGLVRAWLGGRMLPAYLHVEAFDGTTWQEIGTRQFGGHRLLRARMAKVTPDVAILKFTLEAVGDITVTLQRSERQFRIELPFAFPKPSWSGMPPTSRAVAAQNAVGRFGSGLDAGGDADDGTWAAPFPTWAGDSRFRWDGTPYRSDLRLLWPPDATPAAFARAFWYRPERAVTDLGTAGFLTLYDTDGVARVELYLDGADHKIKVRVNDVVKLISAALTFTADTDLLLGVRMSATEGLSLSIRDHLGAVVHLTDATLTDLGCDALYDAAYLVNFSRYGDGSYGDGVWGGTSYFPGGVIDNDMVWRRKITSAEFEALAAATHPHDALPSPEGDLVWYAPFDVEPLPVLPAPVDGVSIDPTVGVSGFQKATLFLDIAETKVAAALVADATFDTAAAQQAQLAAAFEQSTRVA